MVFYLKTKLIENNNTYYFDYMNINIKIDKVFIKNIECNFERDYYFYKHQELNYKNKFVSQIYCFNSQFDLNFFMFIMNITSVGISSIENIFKIGPSEFVQDMKTLTPQHVKQKYQLKENQIVNIYKHFRISSPNSKQDKKKDEMISNLISLGFNKNKVQSIINDDYEIFKNQEMDFVIKKFVEILKNES